MPKFAGRAQAVIENIWATAAVAYSGAEGREQRGLVRRACSRGEMLCAKAALLNAYPRLSGGRGLKTAMEGFALLLPR